MVRQTCIPRIFNLMLFLVFSHNLWAQTTPSPEAYSDSQELENFDPEIVIQGRLTLVSTLLNNPSAQPLLAQALNAEWSLSTLHERVRTQLILRGSLPSPELGSVTPLFQIPRANIRIRFDGWRLTAGITRLSWGEGFLFNAGDLLFGKLGLPSPLGQINPGQESFGDETALMTALYTSLDDYSYIEALVLTPPLPYQPLPRDIALTRAGARLVTKPFGIKTELSYLYNEGAHLAAATLQGHFLANLWASVAANVLDPFQTLNLTFGILSLYNLGGGDSGPISNLSFGLEAQYKPAQAQEDSLWLYPQLSWASPWQDQISLMALVAPFQPSTMISLGYLGRLYQGLTYQLLLSLQGGGATSTFGWNRTGNVSLTAVIDYHF